MADPPHTSLQVLKTKHSMLGESLLPVIAKLKTWDPDTNSGELCRLKKGHQLEEYSLVQLRTEFGRFAGEWVKDLYAIMGIDENLKSVRQLVHLTILKANLVCMPKGQALQNDFQVGADNQLAPRTTVTQSSGAYGMSGANDNISSRSKYTQNLQVTLMSLKQEINALKTKRLDMQVDEALANMRSLASRPKLTVPNVLLDAIGTSLDIYGTPQLSYVEL